MKGVSSAEARKLKKQRAGQFVADFAKLTDIRIPDEQKWYAEAVDLIEDYIVSNTIKIHDFNRYRQMAIVNINDKNWEKGINEIRTDIREWDFIAIINTGFFARLCSAIVRYNSELRSIIGKDYSMLQSQIVKSLSEASCVKELGILLFTHFSEDKLKELLRKNPVHSKTVEIVVKRQERAERERHLILDKIPEKYIDLFPEARKLKRHFVIHSGPTNSGKTYNAICAFLKAETGVYLAPLRLLAYEIFEKANMEEVPCNMVTGEERIEVPFAKHVASTVEMLSHGTRYDVAIIDEAQMLSDSQRGGAWTSAIFGVCADVVYICTAPNAVSLIVKLIEECGDTYEIIQHERMTPLLPDRTTGFSFPKSVMPKDALIVFSKRAVIACAADLQRKGIKTSVIYGSLPYDVRINEVNKFISGETDVVVATDAIGMGLNLPIKRIVFLEDYKFDGVTKRYLYASEVAQIAGRAGRKGIFDIGYYTAYSPKAKEIITGKLAEKLPTLEKAHMDCPRGVLEIQLPLSTILMRWNETYEQEYFEKTNIEREIALCKYLEKESDKKELIFDFIMMPFNEQNEDLKRIWVTLFDIENYGEDSMFSVEELVEKYKSLRNYHAMSLDTLELESQECDLLGYYMNKFNHTEYLDLIKYAKSKISEAMMKIFEKQSLDVRKCKSCGKSIPWNSMYAMCDSCHYTRYYQN